MFKKSIFSWVGLVLTLLISSAHLFAAEEWQPEWYLVKVLVNLSDDEIVSEFPRLVVKDEREEYAILMAQVQIYKFNDLAKAEAFLKLAQVELLGRGKPDGVISTNVLHMSIAGKKNDNVGVVEYGEILLEQMKAEGGASDKRYSHVMTNVSDAYYTLGDFNNALKVAEQLTVILKGADDSALEGEAYFSVAEASIKLGLFDKAEQSAKYSYQLYSNSNDSKGLGHARKVLGNVYLGRGDYKKARESYEEAIVFYEKINNHHGLANCYFNIGLVLTKSNDWEKSIEMFELASFNYMESGSPGGAGMAKMEIGRSFTQLNKFESAQLIFKEARSLLSKTGKAARLKQLSTYENELKTRLASRS